MRLRQYRILNKSSTQQVRETSTVDTEMGLEWFGVQGDKLNALKSVCRSQKPTRPTVHVNDPVGAIPIYSSQGPPNCGLSKARWIALVANAYFKMQFAFLPSCFELTIPNALSGSIFKFLAEQMVFFTVFVPSSGTSFGRPERKPLLGSVTGCGDAYLSRRDYVIWSAELI